MELEKQHELTTCDKTVHCVAHTVYNTMDEEEKAADWLSSYLSKPSAVSVHIDAKCHRGLTALQRAAMMNNWKVAAVLIRAGASVNWLDIKGFAVLHRVASMRLRATLVPEETKLMLVDLLLQRGADIEQTDSGGNTAIQLAAGHYNWLLVKKLLLCGARATLTDSGGYSLLHRLATVSFLDFGSVNVLPSQAVEELTRLLVEAGADFSLRVGRTHDGEMPLHIAARLGDWKTVEVFVQHGADPIFMDPEGSSLLHKMARILTTDELVNERDVRNSMLMTINHLPRTQLSSLITLLQKKGLDIDVPDCHGNSALHVSLKTKWNRIEVTQKPAYWSFLACGAQLNPEKLSRVEKKAFISSLVYVPHDLLPIPRLTQIMRELSTSFGTDKTTFEVALTKAYKKTVVLKNFRVARLLLESGACWDGNVAKLIHQYTFNCRTSRMKWDFRALLKFVLSHRTNVTSGLQSLRHLSTFPVLHYLVNWLDYRTTHSALDVGDIVLVLNMLLAFGANPLQLWHGRSVLSLLLSMHFSYRNELEVLMPILRLFVEAGVSTHQPRLTKREQGLCRYTSTFFCKTYTPLCGTSDHQIAEILIVSGAVTNCEVWNWKQHLLCFRTEKTSRQMWAVLDHFTTQVPSLQSLARLAVSHMIGVGPQRRHFLECKDIPSKIKRYVQFEDLFVDENTYL